LKNQVVALLWYVVCTELINAIIINKIFKNAIMEGNSFVDKNFVGNAFHRLKMVKEIA